MRLFILALLGAVALGCSTTSAVGNNLLGAKFDAHVGTSETGSISGGLSVAGQSGGIGLSVTPKDGDVEITLSADAGVCDLIALFGASPSFCGVPE